ncbi:peptidylprolyl isomerase [Dyella nitratireducens]|uniref:peptidylprolyl isomerase n=1 Tax=Dyella nitratireducens TaxID=1849580 RepID=A0ABQ1FXR9_9GAMM|nr:peptidylprolyl isomerase [Dyella nitratireducens]GGA32213.1 peptidyl-prolyl cis-trans isomerase [Dyella nitratireducens]GLQ42775.1 peptidyl-prolyl cis-trans isomerase [Dyella nitratireducens]
MTILVNGVAVTDQDWPTPQMAAVHELLRQRAVALGWLDHEAEPAAVNEAIERVLAEEVRIPDVDEAACRRYYAQHAQRYQSDELVFARHILFQITQGAPVAAVRAMAEAMLTELRAQPALFAERARRHSNCPSGELGGELGQLQRGATVPEFEQALFEGTALGVLPQLVKTRFGFHIVAVDQRVPGKSLPFEHVHDRVADDLHGDAEARALSQYVRVLAGQAEVQGVELDAATSPLIQ